MGYLLLKREDLVLVMSKGAEVGRAALVEHYRRAAHQIIYIAALFVELLLK